MDAGRIQRAEIERLLKKRQSKLFTEKDKIRLQELIDAREAIEIKYKLTAADAEGFETIADKIEALLADKGYDADVIREELAKAGVSAKDILAGGLAGALDLAAAGTLDVGRAAPGTRVEVALP